MWPFDKIPFKAVDEMEVIHYCCYMVSHLSKSTQNGKTMTKEATNSLTSSAVLPGSSIYIFVEEDKPNGQVIYSNLFPKAFGAYAALAQSDGNYVFCSSIM